MNTSRTTFARNGLERAQVYGVCVCGVDGWLCAAEIVIRTVRKGCRFQMSSFCVLRFDFYLEQLQAALIKLYFIRDCSLRAQFIFHQSDKQSERAEMECGAGWHFKVFFGFFDSPAHFLLDFFIRSNFAAQFLIEANRIANFTCEA